MLYLGMADPFVCAAYLLSVLSALWCIYYGLRHWNDPD